MASLISSEKSTCPEKPAAFQHPAEGCIAPSCHAQAQCAHGYRMLGLSFRDAPLSVRGRVSLSGERLGKLLDTLKGQGVLECAALSTCNRTEIYYLGGETHTVELALCEACDVCLKDIRPYLTERKGLCVACHLFRVTSGLDSAVLGETEIVAQVKEAWRSSVESGAAGRMVDQLFQRGLEVSKRVRTETELCRSVTSTGSLAVREAEKRHGDLKEREVLLVGAGRIAERVAKELHGAGAEKVTVLNRTVENAELVAKTCGAKHGGLDSLAAELKKADVVFTTVAGTQPLLTAELMEDIAKSRDGRAMTIVDLGVPANVQAEIEMTDLEVIDLDTLSAIGSSNLERRAASIPDALEILSGELEKFRLALIKRAAGPTIGALVDRAEEIRNRNLAWAVERKPDLGDDEIKLIDELSRRIVKGLLEAPIAELSGDLANEGHRQMVAKLFHLDEAGNDEHLA